MKNVLFISKPPDKNNIKMSVQKLSQEEELEKNVFLANRRTQDPKKQNAQNNNLLSVNKCLWGIIAELPRAKRSTMGKKIW